MEFTFKTITGTPDDKDLAVIAALYLQIFGTAPTDKFYQRFQQEAGLFTEIVETSDGFPIAYKVGFEVERKVFYSWLGGVLPDYRNRGIAQQLMNRQHQFCIKKGYQKIRSKTTTQWRNMLIINLKNGFNIVHCYPKTDQIWAFVLEKELVWNK